MLLNANALGDVVGFIFYSWWSVIMVKKSEGRGPRGKSFIHRVVVFVANFFDNVVTFSANSSEKFTIPIPKARRAKAIAMLSRGLGLSRRSRLHHSFLGAIWTQGRLHTRRKSRLT